MATFLLVCAIILVVIGFFGSFIPMLPGLPLIFLGFLIRGLASGWTDITFNNIIVIGLITGAVYLLDFYAGAAGAKKFGASRSGIIGAVGGAIAGFLILNIVGLVLGAFGGAVIGEMFAGKDRRAAMKAGWGTFLGIMVGGLIKVITAAALSGWFFYRILTG